MSVTVGVDGGQSQIRMMVSGEARSEATEGVSHLESDVIGSVVDAVGKLWGGRSVRIDRLVAGLTTIPATEDERQDLAAGLADATRASEVWVCGDQVTSHAGAFAGRTGIALSVGTGVACLAVDADSGTHRTFDGAGYLVGDEGGGFWIGRLGIRAALAGYEGRAVSTSLTPAVETELGPLETAAVHLHANPRAVDTIAHMALVVLAQADAGDAVAKSIISDAATRLVSTVTAALSFLPRDGDASVAVDGRLLLDENLLRTMFLSEMYSAHQAVKVVESPGSSLDGAIWLAEHEVPRGYLELITMHRTEP